MTGAAQRKEGRALTSRPEVEPEIVPWTMDVYQAGRDAIERDEAIVRARRALLEKAEEGWRALCPLFIYGELDRSQPAPEDGSGYPRLHPEIPKQLATFIGVLSGSFRDWVGGVAGIPKTEGEFFSPDSDLWAIDYQLGVLLLFRDAPTMDGIFREVLNDAQANIEGFVTEFDRLLWQLEDLLHPESAARRAKQGGGAR